MPLSLKTNTQDCIKTHILRLITFLAFIFMQSGLAGQCNNLNDLVGSFQVLPQQDTCVEISIERLLNNDLALNNGLLGVELNFAHNNVSDLLMELTSPSGQSVILVGDITSGFPTNGSIWNVIFSECAGGAVPDPGLNEVWDNGGPWTIGTPFTGIYYPHQGCLEDFDSGSVNGIWKLRIINSSDFETASINRVGFTLDDDVCVTCAAEAGNQSVTNLDVCLNGNLQIDLGLAGNTSDSDYETVFLVVDQNDSIITVNFDGNFLNLLPGNYNICVASVFADDLSNFIELDLPYSVLQDNIASGSLNLCVDLTDNCTLVNVFEAPPVTVLNETICLGEPLIIGLDTFDVEGTYSAMLPRQGLDQCDTSVVLNLDVIQIQPIIQSSAPQLDCNNPTVTLDASFSTEEFGSTWFWSTEDGAIEGDPTRVSIEISQPGTYTLSQTERSCTRTTSYTITRDSSIPLVSISSDALSCSVEEVELRLSSSLGISSAQWIGPGDFTSNQINPTVDVPGAYSVEVTTVTGCAISVSYLLVQGNDQPTITASVPNISCADPSVQVSVDNTTYERYTWTGPNNFFSNIAEPELPSTGTYYLEVQNEDGCKGFTTVEVLGNEGTFDYQIDGEDFKCIGGRTLISASADVPNAIYQWSGPNDYFSNLPNNQVTEEGTYVVEIFSNGCVVIDSVTLNRDISNLPEYDVQVDNIGDCDNPLWRLTAIPLANEFQAFVVRWGISGVSIIGTGNQIDVNTVGNYFLQILTFDGCSVVERFTIEPLPEAPVINITARNHVSCASGLRGGRLSVTQNDGYAYDWEGPDGFQADSSAIDSIMAGFYNLTVTDTLSGCISFIEARVIGDTIPRNIALTNSNITCNNSEALIRATVNGGGNSYLWNGPSADFTTKDINVTEAGTYVLTVTGGNGCISSDSVVVLSDTSAPDFNLEPTELECSSQSARINPQTTGAGLLYSWVGPGDFTSNAVEPVVFGAGLYELTITGINGCDTTGTINVMANPDTPVAIAESLDTLNCIDLEVMISGQSQNPNNSYSWNGPASFISDLQNPIVSRPGEYVLTVENEEGCIGFDTVEVIREIILPEVTFAFDDQVDCIDDEASLTGISNDPGAEFTWTGPNDYFQSGINVIASDTGTYIYTVRGTNNCVDSDTFRITAGSNTFLSEDIVNCADPFVSVSELSENLNFNIVWTDPNGISYDDEDREALVAGDYEGIVLGSNGCQAEVTVQVSIDTVPPISNIIQIGEIRCEENEISLSSNGSSTGNNITYGWTTDGGGIISNSFEPIIGIQGAGAYALTVTDESNGCTSLTVLQVVEEQQDFLDIVLESEQARCFGESNASISFIEGIGGTAPYVFSLDGIIFSSDSTFNGLLSGEYNFIAKDSFGCIVDTMIVIEPTEELQLDLGGNVDVFLGNEVEITANTNLTMEQIESIRWQIENQLGCSDCLSFTLTPSEDLSIELTIADEKGCTVTDRVKVLVDQEPVLFRPNVFSPNEDGINDVFFISANPGVANFRSLVIFDRWGTKVHEARNLIPGSPEGGWDGKLNGVTALPGVYVYTLEVEMITGAIRTVLGDITIIE